MLVLCCALLRSLECVRELSAACSSSRCSELGCSARLHARAHCWAAAHSNESALMQGTEPEECVVPKSRHGRKGQHCGGKGGGGGQEEESSALVGGKLVGGPEDDAEEDAGFSYRKVERHAW